MNHGLLPVAAVCIRANPFGGPAQLYILLDLVLIYVCDDEQGGWHRPISVMIKSASTVEGRSVAAIVLCTAHLHM